MQSALTSILVDNLQTDILVHTKRTNIVSTIRHISLPQNILQCFCGRDLTPAPTGEAHNVPRPPSSFWQGGEGKGLGGKMEGLLVESALPEMRLPPGIIGWLRGWSKLVLMNRFLALMRDVKWYQMKGKENNWRATSYLLWLVRIHLVFVTHITELKDLVCIINVCMRICVMYTFCTMYVVCIYTVYAVVVVLFVDV